MANIGEEIEIVNIPEPIRVPDFVPNEAPVAVPEVVPEKEPVGV